MSWSPPPRPPWLDQFNRLAATAGSPDALVPLDGPSLLAASRAATGLDDFGGDTWQEGFDLLLSDLEATANLNLMGRVLVRLEIIRSLIARLRIADAYRTRPEIEQEVIHEPVFITGMGRSGTTVLHELLALDPRFRAPLTWELLHPGLPEADGPQSVDHRVTLTDAEHTFWNVITPEFQTMHENRADAPNECGEGLLHEFRSTTWGGQHHVPNYDTWLALGDQAPVFRFHRRLLALLQHGQTGRWLLKDPMHLARLPALFAEYPDAYVIVTHRDPMKVLPSVASLMTTLRWQRSDIVDHDGIVGLLVHSYPFLLNNLIEDRASGAVPEDRVVDVLYASLLRDPIGALAGVYRELGLPFTDEHERRASAYLSERPKDRHGAHDYSFDDLGVSRDETARAFEPYRAHYDVPQEPAG
jgi:hypothetical protein